MAALAAPALPPIAALVLRLAPPPTFWPAPDWNMARDRPESRRARTGTRRRQRVLDVALELCAVEQQLFVAVTKRDKAAVRTLRRKSDALSQQHRTALVALAASQGAGTPPTSVQGGRGGV